MIVCHEWILKWFCYYNKTYFNNLPIPQIVLSRSKNMAGVMRTSSSRFNKKYEIGMSVLYDMTERQAQNILLHEMIHYFIAYNGIKDSSPHGKVFHKYMNELNDKYGWEISVSATHAGLKLIEEPAKDNKGYVVLTMKINNQNYISSVSTKSIKKLNSQLQHVIGLNDSHWYTSKSNFFHNLPKVRSLKAMKIEESKLNELKNEMQLIDGLCIMK